MTSPQAHPPVLPRTVRYGGHTGILRTLQPGDEPYLMKFFASHNEATLRGRYGHSPSPMTNLRAQPLVGVDQTKDSALGIFEQTPAGLHLVAVGRYCLLEGKPAAEVAFVVQEDRRRLGLARTLLQALTAIARPRGLSRFVAQTGSDNHAMLGLFRKCGAQFRKIPGESAVAVTLPLAPVDPSSAPR